MLHGMQVRGAWADGVAAPGAAYGLWRAAAAPPPPAPTRAREHSPRALVPPGGASECTGPQGSGRTALIAPACVAAGPPADLTSGRACSPVMRVSTSPPPPGASPF